MASLNEQLLAAVAAEDLAAARRAVVAGAEVNYTSPGGDSPLLVAIDAMNQELVAWLLAAGATPNPDPAQVYTLPLNAAVDIAVQAFLTEEATSVSNETVELLIRYGADHTQKDRAGRSAPELARNYNSVAGAYLAGLPVPGGTQAAS